MSAVIDAAAGALVFLGSLFVFLGGVGAIRFPDVFTRIHAAGITDTMGTLLVLAGCAVYAGPTLAAVKIAAVLAFLLLTGPTATYALANAARLGGVPAPYTTASRAEENSR